MPSPKADAALVVVLAGAEPHDVRVLGIDGRPRRANTSRAPRRSPSRCCRGSPSSRVARGRSDVPDAGILGIDGDVGDAAGGQARAEAAERERLHHVGGQRRGAGLGGEGGGGQRAGREQQRAHGDIEAWHAVNVSDWLFRSAISEGREKRRFSHRRGARRKCAMLCGVCACPMPMRRGAPGSLLTVAARPAARGRRSSPSPAASGSSSGVIRISSRNAVRAFSDRRAAGGARVAARLRRVARRLARAVARNGCGARRRSRASLRDRRAGHRECATAAARRPRRTSPDMSASRRCGPRGTPQIDVGFAAALPWPDAKETLTPLGYRIGAGGAMVPTYAPGVPLLMALARVAGTCGPYPRGPICGGAAGALHLSARAPALRHGTAFAAPRSWRAARWWCSCR